MALGTAVRLRAVQAALVAGLLARVLAPRAWDASRRALRRFSDAVVGTVIGRARWAALAALVASP